MPAYFFALDDFVDAPHSRPFVELARFLKVDFQLLDPDARKSLAAKYGSPNISLLARKSKLSATSMKPAASASPISRATSSASLP